MSDEMLSPGDKRPMPSSFGTTQLVKRARSDVALAAAGASGSRTNPAGSMPVGTVYELGGHAGLVLSCRFDPAGRYLATASNQKELFLWETSGEYRNVASIAGHKGAVLDLAWAPDSATVHSASADATVCSWDVATCTRVRRHEGHEDVVNCLAASKRGDLILASGSDDSYIGLWDPRAKDAIDFVQHPSSLPVTAVAVSEAGTDLFAGSLDNGIQVWDTRRLDQPAYSLQGHTDTVSSLALSPDGHSLLSFSFDSTARLWDVRPFAPPNRLLATLDGAIGSTDQNLARACWADGGAAGAHKVAAGCGDGTVVVWDTRSGALLQKIPGHKGAVNDVCFLPGSDSVMASASADGTVLFGSI